MSNMAALIIEKKSAAKDDGVTASYAYEMTAAKKISSGEPGCCHNGEMAGSGERAIWQPLVEQRKQSLTLIPNLALALSIQLYHVARRL
jgi:hypothetical protein